ncbi:hypothetical protein E2C01_029789 [Portunus trituberculatus]|uniref:Uncharacterized protein n=1 Tax=Portunus trituberculatus TaxID=210409 RepID=A0A5B7EVH8_PORTR|nr:hypothetical protein [Portunus trituberculatus]
MDDFHTLTDVLEVKDIHTKWHSYVSITTKAFQQRALQCTSLMPVDDAPHQKTHTSVKQDLLPLPKPVQEILMPHGLENIICNTHP